MALVLTGLSSWRSILEGFLWNTVHLLTFQVKNQIDGLEEDRLTKPNRPLPSGRISVENARVLYCVLFMLMWAASLYTKTTLCTFVYSIAIVVYNEGGLAKFAVLKNVIGALGLACYCWGTTMILDHGRELHGMKAFAVFLTGAIFTTTGHAQDFRDRSGDAAMGRKTIPILLPQPVSRWSLGVLILAWTAFLISLWQPPFVASIAFATVGFRCWLGYVSSYDEKDDFVSYCWYGVWLLGASLLPVFPRLRGEIL